MDLPTAIEIAFASVLCTGLVAWGILLLRGSERAFRLLAGGSDFLALDPTEKEYRRTARESGVAMFLIAFLLLCVVGGSLAGRLGAGSSATTWFQAAISAGMALSMAGLLIIVVVQIRRHMRLLNRKQAE